MLERLYEFFLTKPVRILVFGKAVLSCGFALLIAGMFGGITTSVNSIKSVGGRQVANATLAEAYPAFPTWWIPETALGYIIAVLLICSGVAICVSGKRLIRVLGD